MPQGTTGSLENQVMRSTICRERRLDDPDPRGAVGNLTDEIHILVERAIMLSEVLSLSVRYASFETLTMILVNLYKRSRKEIFFYLGHELSRSLNADQSSSRFRACRVFVDKANVR